MTNYLKHTKRASEENAFDSLTTNRPVWVSVGSPPAEGSYVLVHAKGKRRIAALYKGGEYLCYDVVHEEMETVEEPLNWMYLPECPEE